jgi:hypothetical protein
MGIEITSQMYVGIGKKVIVILMIAFFYLYLAGQSKIKKNRQ